MEELAVEKIDVGPATTTFGDNYLGRTKGDTQFSYGVETFKVETEEDGVIDEIVTDDSLTVTVPIEYTDTESMAISIPWAKLVTGTGDKTKLVVGKAIGKRLSDYADKLVIHPIALGDTDKSKDITIFKCYPKPGPIQFTYSRQGTRIANLQFVAMRDPSKPEGEDYFCIGDPAIVEA